MSASSMASDKVWEMKESSLQGQCSLKNPQFIGLLAVNRQLLATVKGMPKPLSCIIILLHERCCFPYVLSHVSVYKHISKFGIWLRKIPSRRLHLYLWTSDCIIATIVLLRFILVFFIT